jgi:hypothetical protein
VPIVAKLLVETEIEPDELMVTSVEVKALAADKVVLLME